MMNSWQASVKRCLRDHLHTMTIQEDVPLNDNQDSTANDEDDSVDKQQPKTAVSPAIDQAILDYDTNKHEAVMVHCPAVTDQTACRELCRFSL